MPRILSIPVLGWCTWCEKPLTSWYYSDSRGERWCQPCYLNHCKEYIPDQEAKDDEA